MKPLITYNELNLIRPKDHQTTLRRQQHASDLVKKSQDVDWSISLVREAKKWPDGHSKERERKRNLRRMKNASNLNRDNGP